MPDNWKQCAVLWGFNLNKKITMYINNLPFPETLHMAQRDIYDINTMLLNPLKKQAKISKRKKIMWRVMSGTEHAVAVTFGVFAASEVYNQQYIMAVLYLALMTIGAVAGFDSGKQSSGYANRAQTLCTDIDEIQNKVNASLPEQLHEIAEAVRQKTVIQR